MNYPTPIMPNEGSQEFTVIVALSRGESLTFLESLERYNIAALSQRCTRLRQKYHWPVESEIVRTASGKRIARYWLP